MVISSRERRRRSWRLPVTRMGTLTACSVNGRSDPCLVPVSCSTSPTLIWNPTHPATSTPSPSQKVLTILKNTTVGLFLLIAHLVNWLNDSFSLTETNSGADSDSDSKPNGYIVLCRICSHCTDLDLGPYSLFLQRQDFESESVPESISDNVNEP